MENPQCTLCILLPSIVLREIAVALFSNRERRVGIFPYKVTDRILVSGVEMR